MRNNYAGDCRCDECQILHAQHIHSTGEFPGMGHEEGQVLKRERIALIQQWQTKAMQAGRLARIP